jgi:UMP-CMP kinase
MNKPQVILIIGGPGAGKGTICNYIINDYNFVGTFSTGDLLRNIVKEKKVEGWEKLDTDMKEGKLISSERVLLFLKNAILNSDKKFILVDGYPRNKENIDAWDKIMTDIVDVKAVLFFDCMEELMKKRIYGRKDGRADDNEDTINRRIRVFEKETKPLCPIFEKKGILIKINCNQKMEYIYEDVKKVLKELKVI